MYTENAVGHCIVLPVRSGHVFNFQSKSQNEASAKLGTQLVLSKISLFGTKFPIFVTIPLLWLSKQALKKCEPIL